MTVPIASRRLAGVYDQPGPFVTVYLDASRDTEQGTQEVTLRWRDVRDHLAGEGADDAALDAVEAAIGEDAGSGGRHGLVAVAANGQLLFADHLPQPPARSVGVLAPLPHLLPYLAQHATAETHVVVLADRTGADLLLVPATGEPEGETVHGGTSYPMHRTATADWSERHFQLRVENTWEANAKDVAAAVGRMVAQHAAKLVVIAGDVRARHLIADALGATPGVDVRLVEEGGRAAGSSAETLHRAVQDEVLRHAWRQRRELLEHLQQNLGRHEYAVAGVPDVVRALRKAQAHTVILSDDPSSTLTAWVGPRATDFGLDDAEAADLGVTAPEHDRFDAALVRAVLGTGARLAVTPGAHDYLPDGIGALLRYDDAAT